MSKNHLLDEETMRWTADAIADAIKDACRNTPEGSCRMGCTHIEDEVISRNFGKDSE